MGHSETSVQPVRTAVVLAAGEGSRLDPSGRQPKPLAPLLGLSLAERALVTSAEAGVRRFVVVLGHQAHEVRAHFEGIARRRRLEVEFEVASKWGLGNGESALAVASSMGELPFFLIMVDHLVDASIYRRLLGEPPGEGEICLAVDRDRDGVFDVADVTKVSLSDGRITEIRKDLDHWDGADTGVFLCTRALFDGLARAREGGRHTLSDGVAELAKEGAARAVDVTGESWLDLDTPAAMKEARRRLISALGKGRDDGYISTLINRRASVPLSALLSRTALTPDFLTVLSFLGCLAGAGLLSTGQYATGLMGGLLVQAASVLDGCDGEIARLKRLATARGGWLDTVLDRYADVGMVVAITFAHSRLHPGSLTWVGGLVAATGFILAS
ncbi:MAG: NTP transferase domain-containing protein, partial [Planctomycetota bacterium]|nr:NTP transferase domain-containing protein [Planctomycetota bacterium]